MSLSKSKYQELAEALGSRIESGKIPGGTFLPLSEAG